jgi:AcrR family transcriptional regulator
LQGVSDTVATPSEATARPMRADARRNRERILKAGRAVFAQYGREAQMDDVARKAKLGVGTLYRHFPTKEALVQALAQDKFDRLQAAAIEALETEDPWEAFAGFVRRAAEQMAADRALHEAVQHANARDAAERAGLRDSMATLIARGQAAGAVRADLVVEDIPMFMCALGSAISMAGRDDARWRRYLELALDGLRARPAS